MDAVDRLDRMFCVLRPRIESSSPTLRRRRQRQQTRRRIRRLSRARRSSGRL
jgi:hypothetical protein